MVCAWVFLHGTAGAHDPGLSTLSITHSAESVEVTMAFSAQDSRSLNLRPSTDTLGIASGICSLSIGGNPIALVSSQVTAGENGDLILGMTFAGEGNGILNVNSKAFDQLPRGHRQYAVIKDGDGKTISTALLSAEHPTVNEPGLDRAQHHEAAAGAFFVLGLEHIFTGYDHLLFLLALLLVCENFRAAATIITCFTLAHSLTLALAALQVVNVPSQFVEVVIAGSIVYVGFENLLRRKHYRYRWLLTIAFGLIHGLGFATALRDASMDAGGNLIAALISFNLGVEAGQIAIAAIVLPIILKFRDRPAFQLRWAPAISIVICLAGSWWIVDRTLFSQ
jgi:hydrogenase/urease accessory protein HupE